MLATKRLKQLKDDKAATIREMEAILAEVGDGDLSDEQTKNYEALETKLPDPRKRAKDLRCRKDQSLTSRYPWLTRRVIELFQLVLQISSTCSDDVKCNAVQQSF